MSNTNEHVENFSLTQGPYAGWIHGDMEDANPEPGSLAYFIKLSLTVVIEVVCGGKYAVTRVPDGDWLWCKLEDLYIQPKLQRAVQRKTDGEKNADLRVGDIVMEETGELHGTVVAVHGGHVTCLDADGGGFGNHASLFKLVARASGGGERLELTEAGNRATESRAHLSGNTEMRRVVTRHHGGHFGLGDFVQSKQGGMGHVVLIVEDWIAVRQKSSGELSVDKSENIELLQSVVEPSAEEFHVIWHKGSERPDLVRVGVTVLNTDQNDEAMCVLAVAGGCVMLSAFNTIGAISVLLKEIAVAEVVAGPEAAFGTEGGGGGANGEEAEGGGEQ